MMAQSFGLVWAIRDRIIRVAIDRPSELARRAAQHGIEDPTGGTVRFHVHPSWSSE